MLVVVMVMVVVGVCAWGGGVEMVALVTARARTAHDALVHPPTSLQEADFVCILIIMTYPVGCRILRFCFVLGLIELLQTSRSTQPPSRLSPRITSTTTNARGGGGSQQNNLSYDDGNNNQQQ